MIAATPDRAFEALTDPAILQQAITGCEDGRPARTNITPTSSLSARGGNYVGKVRLTDKQPPHKFTLKLEGERRAGLRERHDPRRAARKGRGPNCATADVQVD